MKKLNFIYLVLIVFGISVQSCEKDDICAEGTPTTPHLILRFYDVGNTDETLSVSNLLVYGLDDNDEIVNFQGLIIGTTDSIAIPLRTDGNQSKIVLHSNYSVDTNGTTDPSDDIILGNPDVITITYTKEDVYVSRACGFKTVFNNAIFNVALDGDNWIINSEVINPNIESETTAHVKVYH